MIVLLQISREMQICLNAEIKISELLLSNPCLLHQKPHTTAKGNAVPKPEHLWPPWHVYSTVTLALGVLLSVARELAGGKVEDHFYATVIMFSETG